MKNILKTMSHPLRLWLRGCIYLTTLTVMISTVHAAALPVPSPPTGSARSYILLDFHSGAVVAEQQSAERVEPASITKLMTAYTVFNELKQGNISLKDLVTVSEKAWRTPGSRMFIEAGKQVSVEDLLKGMIIQSGNDASVALSEFIAGSETAFSALMNHHAEQLGLSNSNFVNSTGLPHVDHYTTARDISLLAHALIRHYPEYYKWYSIREFTYNDITQANRNKLLWQDHSVDGIKTGHTDSAGYCLVTSAQREGMRLISVVLGAKSETARLKESQALLNFGYRFFETKKMYEKEQEITQARAWKGTQEWAPLGLNHDLYITLPKGQYDQLQITSKVVSGIQAPIKKHMPYGNLEIKLDDKVLVQKPLIALQDVATGSLWQQVVDEVKLYFE